MTIADSAGIRSGECRCYWFRGRPVVAFSGTGLGRRVALERYQPTTPRRKAFRAGVALASAIGVDRWLARPQPSTFPSDLDPAVTAWLSSALSDLGAAPDGVVVMWPPQPGRGRLYVHAADATGRPVAFVKVALEPRNAQQIAREVETLDALNRDGLSVVHLPVVRAVHRTGGGLVAIEDPLPEDARSPTGRNGAFPAAAVTDFAGAARPLIGVAATSWWHSYRHNVTPALTTFDEELTRLAGGGIATVRAHGDLSVHNMAFSGDRLWLVDWEESAPDAPVLADRLGFELSTITRALLRRPASWRAHLRTRPAAAALEKAPRRDLMLALAFRCARGFADVTGIVEHWDRSTGWGT